MAEGEGQPFQLLHLRPKGALEKADFAQLARTVDPFIESKGDLAGIIVDAPGFPGWDSFGAMTAHFRSCTTRKSSGSCG